MRPSTFVHHSFGLFNKLAIILSGGRLMANPKTSLLRILFFFAYSYQPLHMNFSLHSTLPNLLAQPTFNFSNINHIFYYLTTNLFFTQQCASNTRTRANARVCY